MRCRLRRRKSIHNDRFALNPAVLAAHRFTARNRAITNCRTLSAAHRRALMRAPTGGFIFFESYYSTQYHSATSPLCTLSEGQITHFSPPAQGAGAAPAGWGNVRCRMYTLPLHGGDAFRKSRSASSSLSLPSCGLVFDRLRNRPAVCRCGEYDRLGAQGAPSLFSVTCVVYGIRRPSACAECALRWAAEDTVS